jgi:type IV pilus assembly protein PilC
MIQTYAFIARDMNGRKLKGTLNAGSETEAIQSLSRHGYTVTHCAAVRREHHLLERKVSLKDLSVMCRQLGSLLKAGLPITQAVRLVRDQVRYKKLKRVLDQTAAALAAGESVHQAFGKHLHVFPPLFLHMLQAAETTGGLDKKFHDLAVHFQRDYQVRQKIKQAFLYPAFILVFAVVLMNILLLVALPTFIENFAADGSLPLLTHVLWTVSRFMSRYGIFTVIGALTAGILLSKSIRTRHRRSWDAWKLRIPVVGSLNRKIAAYRFSETLSELTAAGVPINRALDVTSEAVNNRVLTEAVLQARDKVQNGLSISQALQESGVLSGMVVSMIRIGEESGDMAALLKDAAEFSRMELEHDMDRLIALIEPAMIVCIGLLVGTMVIGMMLPVYDGMTQIQ